MWRSELKRLVRYGLVGIVNTLAAFAVILAAMALGASPVLANALGYACGLTISVVLNARWSFQSTLDGMAALRFIAAFGVAFGLNLLVLNAALPSLGPVVSQILAVAAYQVVFFLLLRLAVFRPNAGGQ